MLYLVSQMVVGLALASALGIAVGWWIHALRIRERAAARDKELDRAHREVSQLEAKLGEVGPRSMLLEPRVAQLEAEKRDIGAVLENALRDAERESIAGPRGWRRGEVEAMHARVAVAEAQAEDATRESEEAHRRITELEQMALAYKAKLADLGAAAPANEPVEAGRAAHEETRRRLEEVTSVHADCDFAFETLRQKILMLRDEVATLKERRAVARLEHGGAPALAPIDERTRPGTLLGTPTRLPDDLKQINGIGPQLERILNELGVYYFQQMASFSQDEAEWLDCQLADYRGRVKRDGWIDQARGLIQGLPHSKEY